MIGYPLAAIMVLGVFCVIYFMGYFFITCSGGGMFNDSDGTIKNCYPAKGFAFIRGDDGKDYFMHKSSLKNARIEDLGIGQEVEFEDAVSDKGLRAEDVRV